MPVEISKKGVLRHINDADGDGTKPLPPPVDTGPAAWKYLFASFVIEAVLCGEYQVRRGSFCYPIPPVPIGVSADLPLGFGVFEDHYSALPQFENKNDIPVIGALYTSFYYLGGPVLSLLIKRVQRWQRHLVVTGSIMCALSLLAASFANSVDGLISTQGVLCGIGFAMLYYLALRMLDEWFARRRGLAHCVPNAGGGLSGAGLPFPLEALLSKYGYRATLRAACVALCILVAPILPLIRGRLPAASTLAPIDWSFFRQPLF